MTATQFLQMLRRKLADVDPSALRRGTQELWETVEDERVELAVRQVAGFSSLTVGLNATVSGTYGLQGATDDQAVILVYRTALSLLDTTYRARVDGGELGISWRSGLEEESSIAAERAYRSLLDGLRTQGDELLVTYQRLVANRRMA